MWSIDELQQVWQLVSKLHDGQKYGGQQKGEEIEYINHIGSVTFEILKAITEEKAMNANLAIKCGLLEPRSGTVGIWTDDCSMALAMSTSLIHYKGKFNPKHIRYMFMLWIFNGLSNGGRKHSIGLGGNIKISI